MAVAEVVAPQWTLPNTVAIIHHMGHLQGAVEVVEDLLVWVLVVVVVEVGTELIEVGPWIDHCLMQTSVVVVAVALLLLTMTVVEILTIAAMEVLELDH